jgi:hypothetical protein
MAIMYVMVSYVLGNGHFERTSLSNQWSQAWSDQWPIHYVMVSYVSCGGHDRVVMSYVLGLTIRSINSYMI